MNIIRRSIQLSFQPLRSTTSATTSCSLKFCNAGRCANLLNPKEENHSSTHPVIHQRLVYTTPWYIATWIPSQKRSRWTRKVEQSVSVRGGIISRFSNSSHHNQLGLMAALHFQGLQFRAACNAYCTGPGTWGSYMTMILEDLHEVWDWCSQLVTSATAHRVWDLLTSVQRASPTNSPARALILFTGGIDPVTCI